MGPRQPKLVELGRHAPPSDVALVDPVPDRHPGRMRWIPGAPLPGGGGFNDRGLAALKGMASLETLVLKNTRVTSEGLRLLADLPKLRSLTIFCEPRLGVLDDSGLAHLSELRQLESLKITGEWASREGVVKLKATMPRCQVISDSER